MKLRFKSLNIVDHSATGESARNQRKTRGKLLKDVAEAMGISLSYLSDLERGKRNWDQPLADKFTIAMNGAK